MLKRQLKNAQNEMIKMRAADVGGQQERSSLEELFLRCVDTIKKMWKDAKQIHLQDLNQHS